MTCSYRASCSLSHASSLISAASDATALSEENELILARFKCNVVSNAERAFARSAANPFAIGEQTRTVIETGGLFLGLRSRFRSRKRSAIWWQNDCSISWG